MTHDAHMASHCRNCGAALNLQPRPNFCPRCGQETVLHPPTFWEFVHEFVGHYIALEGALWRTLFSLLLKPGRLTSEYFAGRRRRYVLPLRLYLSASFLFFVLVKLGGVGANVNFSVDGAVDARSRPLARSAESSAQASARLREAQACVAQPGSCGWVDTQSARLQVKAAEAAKDPAGFQRRIHSMAPYTVFVLLPVFAGIVMLAYRRRRMNYGAHFVFSLHMHSFWFVALLAMALSPKWLEDLLALATVGYGLYALQHVYHGRWWTTALRALAISAAYAVLFVAAVLAMVMLSLLLG